MHPLREICCNLPTPNKLGENITRTAQGSALMEAALTLAVLEMQVLALSYRKIGLHTS